LAITTEDNVTRTIRTLFATAGLISIIAASPSYAQQTMRVRAQIEKVDGTTLSVKARNGSALTVKMSPDYRVAAMVKATLADLKPDTYIGVTAMPQADGTQKAVAIHIFQANQRGTGEGHRPWDLPGTTMTNAAIETTVAATDGQVITVKYKQGDKVDERKFVVAPQTVIVRYVPGDKSELKPGVHIIIGSAKKMPDGTLEATALNYGRDGIVPPM
jgi:hypothetical protein